MTDERENTDDIFEPDVDLGFVHITQFSCDGQDFWRDGHTFHKVKSGKVIRLNTWHTYCRACEVFFGQETLVSQNKNTRFPLDNDPFSGRRLCDEHRNEHGKWSDFYLSKNRNGLRMAIKSNLTDDIINLRELYRLTCITLGHQPPWGAYLNVAKTVTKEAEFQIPEEKPRDRRHSIMLGKTLSKPFVMRSDKNFRSPRAQQLYETYVYLANIFGFDEFYKIDTMTDRMLIDENVRFESYFIIELTGFSNLTNSYAAGRRKLYDTLTRLHQVGCVEKVKKGQNYWRFLDNFDRATEPNANQ